MQKQVDYSRAIASKYPEQIVIGIARDRHGKHNPITLGWTMIVSHEPPMMAVAIGKTRYSLETFRQAGEFVIAFPSEHQRDEAMLFGTKSGRDTDKLADAGCPVLPASEIDSVLLADAVANGVPSCASTPSTPKVPASCTSTPTLICRSPYRWGLPSSASVTSAICPMGASSLSLMTSR